MNKTIAYITDIHLDETFLMENGVNSRENLKKILRDLKSKNISEIIFGGDIGEYSSNKWFFTTMNDFTKNMQCILGNHDSHNEVKKHYTHHLSKSKTELYYSYEDNFYKYCMLDTSSDKVSEEQLIFLQKELQTDKKIILYVHHPVLKVNTPVDEKYPLANSEKVKKLLLNHSKQVTIFCGHYHMEDEQEISNIKQYITPASSYQMVKDATILELNMSIFGYRLIHFIDDSIKTEIVLFNQ